MIGVPPLLVRYPTMWSLALPSYQPMPTALKLVLLRVAAISVVMVYGAVGALMKRPITVDVVPLVGALRQMPTALSVTVVVPWLSQFVRPIPAEVGVADMI